MPSSSRKNSQRSYLFIVLFLAACGFMGMVFAEKNPATAHDADSDVSQSLQQFTQVYDIIEQNYAEPVNPDKAIYNGAIPGMLHVRTDQRGRPSNFCIFWRYRQTARVS